MWMRDWVRLRETRRREITLNERTNRPYNVRLDTLFHLRARAAYEARGRSWSKSGVREAWRIQAVTVLTEILGESHSLNNDLQGLWTHSSNRSRNIDWEKEGWHEAAGILDAAIASYKFMNTKIEDSTVANTLDPDLMARIEHVFRAEDWTAVASLAATFVEDRFRVWAGLDHSSFGVNLMTKVLHPETGVFPLGIAAAERDGWHQLGRGFVGACSNVDRHRIQTRDDLRMYAIGVLGTASLLLTQMRHQHSNSFIAELRDYLPSLARLKATDTAGTMAVRD